MNNEATLTFEDISTVIQNSDPVINTATIRDEIERGLKLYDHRLLLRKVRNSKIKPLYTEAQKKKKEMSHIAFYKYVYVPPPLQPKHKDCKHTGRIVFDRDLLTAEEHIDFLARPKKNFMRKYKHYPRAYFVRRYYPHCTTRIDFLANPKGLYIKGTWKHHAQHLNARHRACLTHYLIKSKLTSTTVENALTFMKEEKKQEARRKNLFARKMRKLKKNVVCERRKQAKKIINAVFEVAKEFLMTESYETIPEIEEFSNVLFKFIMSFTSSEAPTNQFQNVLQVLSYNLAGWIVRIFDNCGFENILERNIDNAPECSPCEHANVDYLPVEDFIPFSSSTLLDEAETDFEDLEGEFSDEG